MKTCFKCQKEKPICEFYPHKKMADGHLNKCKDCTKLDEKNRFIEKMKDPEWAIKERKRQREKEEKRRVLGLVKSFTRGPIRRYKEPGMVANAVCSGKLVKLPCQVCGNQRAQGHHEDYSKPLDVVWLCTRHHADRHIHLRDRKTLQQDPMPIAEFIEVLKLSILA